jgi:hypothetical protein
MTRRFQAPVAVLAAFCLLPLAALAADKDPKKAAEQAEKQQKAKKTQGQEEGPGPDREPRRR